MLVHDGGHVARVVREHDAVGADVLRARPARAARRALALRLRRAASCTRVPALAFTRLARFFTLRRKLLPDSTSRIHRYFSHIQVVLA